MGEATQAVAAVETVRLYQDRGLTQEVTGAPAVFRDGGRVYLTVSNGVSSAGTTTVSVANQQTLPETVAVEVSDDGQYFDKTAGDGIYTGMFIVTTKLTLSPSRVQSPDTPRGLCYQIVKNLHVEDGGQCTLTADLDNDGSGAAQTIRLTGLFKVAAGGIRDTSAVVTWNTSDSGYGKVEYGPTSGYGRTVALETPVEDLRQYHEATLTGLTPGTFYHYRVSTLDTYGKRRTSEDHTFTTLTAAQLDAALRAARSQGDLPKVYYVKIGGNNELNGSTTATAWADPAYAAQKAEAGDVVCLLGGTWTDQHLVFAHSGIDSAPITLTTADGGMSVLDGVDKSGTAVTLNGRSYVNLSGIRWTNYGNAVSAQSGASDLHIGHFIAENLGGSAVTFSGSQTFRRVVITDFEASATGGMTLTYGSGVDFADIEILNFSIHNTSNAGIYWRFAEGLHINNGRLTRIGDDAVAFTYSIYNSIMENLVVNRTGWHGVAIHDGTTGNYPSFNNTIRRCEIMYAGHNHVDLHSGAFNVLVENCMMHEESNQCIGLFYHNRGEGMIARNNHIYNVYRGFYAEGMGGLVMNQMVLENNTIHDCSYYNDYCVGNNVTFKGNRIYNNPASVDIALWTCGGNIVMEENDVAGQNCRFSSGSNNFVRNPNDEKFSVRCSDGAKATLEYTNGRVYQQWLSWSADSHLGYTAPLWTPTGSYTKMSSTAGTYGFILTIKSYPMTARPVTGTAKVAIKTFDTALAKGQVLVKFDSEATSPNQTDFVIGSLKAAANYLVRRDGADYHVVKANANSCIAFSDTTCANCQFTVIETDLAADLITPEDQNLASPKWVPLPPRNLAAAVTNRRVALSWDPPLQDGGSAVANYKIYRGTETCSGTLLAQVNAVPAYEDRDVAHGTTYYYRVTAVNAVGESWPGNEVSACGIRYSGSASQVWVYPNPYVKGKSSGNRMTFGNMPKTATLRVYTLSGAKIRTMEYASQSDGGKAEWDISGMAAGIYLYLVDYPGGTQKGKFCIVK